MLGLLTPDEGEIEVHGDNPDPGPFPHWLYATVSSFRSPLSRNGARDCAYGPDEGWYPLGRFKREDEYRAQAALSRLGMEGMAHRTFASLSGGQRQRILIARALATEPQLLLLDEPTANVDQATECDLLRLLHEMSTQITCIIVSHDLGFVSPYVSRVVCVNRRVMVHDTAHLTGDMIMSLYGSDVRMVRHQHQG